MSETIQDQNGNDVSVFVAFNGPFVDAVLRADTQADFEAAAVGQDLMIEETDDEGNVTLRPARGVNISPIGPVVIEQGTYDEDGNQLTAPTMDDRYHVNMRIAEPALSKVDEHRFPKWKGTAIGWTIYGDTDPNVNAQEVGKKLNKVVLIDPATIQTPLRVWA